MSTTINTLMKQLKAYVVKSYASASKPVFQEAKHPEVMVFKNYTPLDLLPFDGLGGPYANFAGHDASRGLAKNSFDADMLTDPKDPIDKLEDLAADEWDSLREWEQHFASKYLFSAELPDELQLVILGQLPLKDLLKSTEVCHRWRSLVYSGSLWTAINMSPVYKLIPNNTIIELIVSSGKFLKEANFRGCIQLESLGLEKLTTCCPNVEVLNVRDCQHLSSFDIGRFLEKAANLKVLDVSGLRKVKPATLANAKCSKLERLEMSWCTNITGADILPLVQQCSATLTYLKINKCPGLDNEDTMLSLGNNLPNLTHLSLAYCTDLTDSALETFLSSSPSRKITHLNLSGCANLSDTTLSNLARYTQEIQHLELANCQLMTDRGLSPLFARVQTFTFLDLEGIFQLTTTSVSSIADHQPHLQRLCLSDCAHVSDADVEDLVKRCPELYHLEMDNCMITDVALKSIADHLEQQQEPRELRLEVLDCRNLSEKGIKTIMKSSSLLTIKSIFSFEDDDNESSNRSGRYRAFSSRRQRRIHADDGCLIC
ncbi:hypothetical protein BD408DRAFT_452419 [Parasitella parasitica]|nr:hypothetical protein BD408DRAFT_452419 [Parasitella parasitica]